MTDLAPRCDSDEEQTRAMSDEVTPTRGPRLLMGRLLSLAATAHDDRVPF